jgi:hypothetical protein
MVHLGKLASAVFEDFVPFWNDNSGLMSDPEPPNLVRSRRLELPWGFPHQHLKLARIPFRHDRDKDLYPQSDGKINMNFCVGSIFDAVIFVERIIQSASF